LIDEAARTNRRGLVRRAAAAALGLAALRSVTDAEQAQAADGDALLVGRANSAVSKTSLTTSGTIANDAAVLITAANADYGLEAQGSAIGLVGSASVGVVGVGSAGGFFSGSDVTISLDPTTTSGPPTDQTYKGDMVLDADGVLWLCVADGAPGTWIRVSHGGTRLLPSPQRAYSSSDVGNGSKMNQGETRTIAIGGAVSGVPAIALGVVVNITVHDTVSGGYATVYPAGASRPATSTINWSTTGQSIANGATIGLGTNGGISIFTDAGVPAGSPATHIIVDVTGYIL
jgi:hypothetical protein